ncbi:MAG TPA: choice-of-anchor D domain-containing protein, partial [Terriglobia bacterium]|nr:choice-of-anchor D domain-containing protein [Terriglobia bacterium]
MAAGDTVYVFIGNGNGTFAGPATYPVAFTGTNNPILGFTVGDFNGDGNPDLAVGGKPGLAVLPGTGTGSFGAPIYSTISGAGFQTAVAGDFNNDGKIDLAASGVLYLGKGDGTFTQSTAFLAGVAGFLTSADFNSDGVPDLATAGSGLTSSSPVATVYLTAAAANLAPSPPSFEQVPAGQSSPPQTVTLTNLGIVALSDLSVSTTGEFSQTSTCALSLNPSSQCQTEVTFAPAAAGPQSGALVVSDNALPNPQVVALSGTGTGPGIGLSPASLNFNVQEVGTPSAPQTLMVSNPGTAALTVSSIAASANYGATNTCTTAPVEAGSSCTVTVTFTPTASGVLNGNITITSDANNQAGSAQTVPLTGTGSVVALSLSPTSLDLGSVIVGAASAAQTVTLTNTGTAALGITTIAASGDFTATNTCGTSVAVGGKCTITVTFKPSAGGSRTGALTLTDSAPGSPQTVTLDGAGEDFTLGAASGASTTASVSPGQPATYTLSLTGLGGITLPISFACTGAPAESSCSVSPASVTPGASAASVTVTVATTAPSIVVPPASGGRDLRRMKSDTTRSAGGLMSRAPSNGVGLLVKASRRARLASGHQNFPLVPSASS